VGQKSKGEKIQQEACNEIKGQKKRSKRGYQRLKKLGEGDIIKKE
jgi:hypothetical protein